MGGVVVARGANAEAAVRLGAVPLLRRPHHRLTIWSAPGVALGFCGERGGLVQRDDAVVAVDGEVELGERVASRDEAAGAVLRSYGCDRDRLPGLDGQFAAAVWDARREELSLVVDLLGTRPLYLAERDGLLVAASELKAVIAAGIEPRLDLDGAAQLLAYEHLLGECTLLDGVRLLPPASTTVLGVDSVRTSDRGRYRAAPESTRDPDEAVETFARLLEPAVARRHDEATGLALSGGLDSRCIASMLKLRRLPSHAFTFAAQGSQEIRHASRVAKASGLEHHVLLLGLGYVAVAAPECVWLSEGQIRCFHSHHLALRDVRARLGITSLLVGYAGDAVVRAGPLAQSLAADRDRSVTELRDLLHERSAVAVSDVQLQRLLSSRFAADLSERAREALGAVLAELDGPSRVRYVDYAVQEVYRRKIIPGSELFADDAVHRDPYVDSELLRFLSGLPLRLRAEHPVQPAYLRRFPALARVPNTDDGIPPALEGWRRSVARQAVRGRRVTRTRLDRARRRSGAPAHRSSDYASHLRTDEGTRLLGILLDERTLDRGQLRPDAVRTLVDETLAGSARHTQPLGTLLTLELFQRQFVDGDGYAPPEPGWDAGERGPEGTSTLPAC